MAARDRLSHTLSGGYYAGIIAGNLFHHGHDNDASGPILGKQFTWDFADHWALETHFADALVRGSNRLNAMLLQTEQVLFVDANLLYYPHGMSCWRPFVRLGVGLDDFGFLNEQHQHKNRGLLGIPWGIGIKHSVNDWLTLRLDACDNMAIGDGRLHTIHNDSLTCGAQVDFDGVRRLAKRFRH